MKAELDEQAAKAVFVSSYVTGTGMAAPERVVPNDHFASYLETSDEWIQERTGIQERRWAGPEVSASELAEPACREAIKSAGLTTDDIDGIVLATVTPDYIFPSTACFLQKRLGISKAFAFDVNAVCSGFIYALVTGNSLIAAGQCTNVLVVGVDIYSRIIDPNDRTTCVLFGDGAGAVVLSAVEGVSNGHRHGGPAGFVGKEADMNSTRGFLGSELHSDGKYTDILCVPSGTAKPVTPESIQTNEHYLQMAGREVFKLAVRGLHDVTCNLLESCGVGVDEVDYFLSHQANARILSAYAKQLGVAEEKVLMNVQRYGNTSAASVPILLDESVKNGTINEGDLLLLSAIGGGLTWGAILLRW